MHLQAHESVYYWIFLVSPTVHRLVRQTILVFIDNFPVDDSRAVGQFLNKSLVQTILRLKVMHN